MRSRLLIIASLAALLPMAGTSPAQQKGQPEVPDAPQPQKKPAPPPETPSSETSPADTGQKPQGKDDNAFPEDVSRAAAARAAEQDSQGAEDAPATKSPAGKRSAADANPFPEDVSRDAAKAAGNDPDPPAPQKSDLPPGVSSSQSQGPGEGDSGGVSDVKAIDPGRANKDTEVGGFYLKSGNLQGALQRFKDASAADPTNVNAIFGLAEVERLLGNTAEAVRNYQLYLDIVPNGPKARESMKALNSLRKKQ